MEKNKIYNIEGLIWNEETRKFSLDSELKPVVNRSYNKKCQTGAVTTTQKDMCPNFNDKWAKYADSLEKKFGVPSSRKTSSSSKTDSIDDDDTDN